VLVYHKLISC